MSQKNFQLITISIFCCCSNTDLETETELRICCPLASLYEALNVIHVYVLGRNLAAPRHPASDICTRPGVLVLAVVQRAQCEITIPRQPSIRPDNLFQVGVEVHSPGIRFPWPAKVDFLNLRVRIVVLQVVVRAGDHAVIEDQPGGLCRISPTVGSDGVGGALFRRELAGGDQYGAVVEDGGGVAEDEIDGSLDAAGPVELAERVHEQRVLVAEELAVLDEGEVAVRPERHRLVAVGTGGVLECDSACHEAVAVHSCQPTNETLCEAGKQKLR